MLGTIMAANVFFVIIPAHRKLVARDGGGARAGRRAAARGEEPLGAQQLPHAAGRCFTMLAGHFAFVFGADEAWLVLRARSRCSTALIRVFFNRWHAGSARGGSRQSPPSASSRSRSGCGPTTRERASARPVTFEQIQPVMAERAARSATRARRRRSGSGSRRAEQIEARIDDIERQAVQTHDDASGERDGHDGGRTRRSSRRGSRSRDRASDRSNVGPSCCGRFARCSRSPPVTFASRRAVAESGAGHRRGVPRPAAARVEDHPRPLVGRRRVDSDGRARRRHRARERDELPEPGRARSSTRAA